MSMLEVLETGASEPCDLRFPPVSGRYMTLSAEIRTSIEAIGKKTWESLAQR